MARPHRPVTRPPSPPCLLLAIALAGGCGGGGDPEASLGDRWREDPEAVRADLAGMADPVARAEAVLSLARAFPGESSGLCTLLEAGLEAEWCQQIHLRPHLRRDAAAAPPRLAPARNRYLSFRDEFEARVALGETERSPRPAAADPRLAAADEILARVDQLVQDARVEEATTTCRAVPVEFYRWQCHRHLSWSLARLPEAELLGAWGVEATGACLEAGYLAGECVLGVVDAAARGLAAGPQGPSLLARVQRFTDSLEQGLAGQDRDLVADTVDFAWGYVLGAQEGGAPARLVPAPTEVLSAGAQAHVREAMALRLLELGLLPSGDLLGGAALVEEALAGRLPAARLQAPRTRGPLAGSTWAGFTGSGEASATWWLGQEPRLTVSDPLADAAICVLEAEHRLPSPDSALFRQGLDHPLPEVRQTAERLLQARDGARSGGGPPPEVP